MAEVRHNWTKEEITHLYDLPFADLIHEAHEVHIQNFTKNTMQLSALFSIKTGACPEDCKYCSQSIYNKTGVEKEQLMELDQILELAKKAKERGATRFCAACAWRKPTDRNIEKMCEIVKEVKQLGLETCFSLGMLSPTQAQKLKAAGLDYYNHNIDTSPEYYPEITTTRTYDDRLETLENLRVAGINVCSGGILGLGESKEDRVSFLQQLANLPEHPQSVPINKLARVPGTPFANNEPLDDLDLVRAIAVARILMPKSFIRLSAGRDSLNPATQALCFYAGANSFFYGSEKMLTEKVKNPAHDADLKLLSTLGITPVSEVEQLLP